MNSHRQSHIPSSASALKTRLSPSLSNHVVNLSGQQLATRFFHVTVRMPLTYVMDHESALQPSEYGLSERVPRHPESSTETGSIRSAEAVALVVSVMTNAMTASGSIRFISEVFEAEHYEVVKRLQSLSLAKIPNFYEITNCLKISLALSTARTCKFI